MFPTPIHQPLQQYLQHKQLTFFPLFQKPILLLKANSSPTLLNIWPLMCSWFHFWGYLLSSSIFSPPYCQLFSTLTIAFNIHAVLSPVFKQTFLVIYPRRVTTSLFRSIAIQTAWKCLHSPFLFLTFCSLFPTFQSNFVRSQQSFMLYI